MFSAPTAIRVLKKQDPALPEEARPVAACAALFLAGEPLDEPTARWISDGAGRADHRQLLADRNRLADPRPSPTASSRRRASSAAPALPMYGYDVKLLARGDRRGAAAPNEKGVVVDRAAAAAGLHADRLGRRRALRRHLLQERSRASWSIRTFDWGIRDADGYYFILGRTDDVINVAGHRLGTREIEESDQQPSERRRGARWSAWPTRSRGRCAMAFAVARRTPARAATPRRRADAAKAR